MEKQGSERTDRGLDVQDGVGRACWKKLGTGKWATRRRVGFRPPEKSGAWEGFWLRCGEKSCRSPLCAPDDVVGVGNYHWKKVAGKMLTVMRVF